MTNLVVTADIDGTNTRLAAYRGNAVLKSAQHATGSHTDLSDVFRDFAQDLEAAPTVVVAAAAGPVQNNSVLLTNAEKLLCGADIKKATGAEQARVINDFAAAAWATAAVSKNDINALQGEAHPKDGMRVVVGPGTGLGVGSLIQIDGRYHDIPGEGGHIGLAPANRSEVEVFEAFRTLWPEVFFGDSLTLEAEAVLSGLGLPTLYRAVQIASGAAISDISTRDIFAHAKDKTDPHAVHSIEIFKSHLARVCGDLGLSQWAVGGVFIVGGVAAKNPRLFDDAFVQTLNAGGRFRKLREKLSLYHLTNPEFGLLGARNFARFAMSY